MKILITGGFGLIGSHVVETLDSLGEEVVTYSWLREHQVPFLGRNKSLRIIKGDVRDIKSLTKAVTETCPDVVIHLAAITGIKRCLDRPREAFEVNVYGTFNVVDAIVKSKPKPKLIFASSREVYGDTVGGETSEDAPVLPNNLYGVTKALAENVIAWAGRKHQMRYTILRFTNVYGPCGDKYGVQILIKKVLAGEKVYILGGKQVMNFLHVKDAAHAIMMCLNTEKSDGEIFNIGSYDNLTINELVEKLFQITSKNSEVEYRPYRKTETLFFKPALDKAARVLGWKPEIDINTGLASTLEWYRRKDTS